jgi:hypothetical protein
MTPQTVDHKGAIGQSESTCWVVCIEMEFVPPESEIYTLSPLVIDINTARKHVVKELITK